MNRLEESELVAACNENVRLRAALEAAERERDEAFEDGLRIGRDGLAAHLAGQGLDDLRAERDALKEQVEAAREALNDALSLVGWIDSRWDAEARNDWPAVDDAIATVAQIEGRIAAALARLDQQETE